MTGLRGWHASTLRARLTLGLVVVLLASFVVTGAATALFLRGFLLGRLDSQLKAARGRFAISLEHGRFAPGGDDGDADNGTPGQSVGTLGARLVRGRVTAAAVVEPDGNNRKVRFSAGDIATLRSARVGGTADSVHLDALGDYRIEAVAGRDGDVQVTGLPTREVAEVMRRLVAIEVALFAVTVTISGLVTVVGVGRTLRPLRRVADTALQVSELPLTDAATRLPDGIAPVDPSTEVDQVSVAFDHMLEHVRSALAARDHTEDRLRRFVADASHELRTPLATIKAYSEYAVRSGERLPEIAVTAFARIDVAATRMGTLVDDLLLLARLDAGRPLAGDLVDLSQLVLETVDDARTAAPQHRWHLDLPEEPVEVIGDEKRLHQVLANLLSNARTHTPPGTTVTTSVSVADGRVHLEVSDDGPGIPPGLKDNLFDRFSRGDASRTSDHGSTGLGLAIAHGIAAAHRGTLEVASRPGLTCFGLRLPCALR